jgi:hypothetical protein
VGKTRTSVALICTGIRIGMKTRLVKIETDWRTFQNNYERNRKKMRVALSHVIAMELDESEK